MDEIFSSRCEQEEIATPLGMRRPMHILELRVGCDDDGAGPALAPELDERELRTCT